MDSTILSEGVTAKSKSDGCEVTLFRASEGRLSVAETRIRKGCKKRFKDYKPDITSLRGMTNANIIINHSTLQSEQELPSVIRDVAKLIYFLWDFLRPQDRRFSDDMVKNTEAKDSASNPYAFCLQAGRPAFRVEHSVAVGTLHVMIPEN